MINWIVTFIAVTILGAVSGYNLAMKKYHPGLWGPDVFITISVLTLLIILMGGILQ